MPPRLEQLRSALTPRFAVRHEIGHGGMATVYLAHDTKHDREVAVKVLQPELAATLGADRFAREISIAARLNHPHIVPLFDSGQADGFLYYVMPYVDGTTLRSEMRAGPLPLQTCLTVLRDVGEGLSYAHAQGVIHRDVKPENIMFAGGHAVVTDFGVARAVEVAGGETLTSSGLIVGTPAYMSPEQATGAKEVDARSDVYSLGCVFFEMLTGRPPFDADNVRGLIAGHLVGEVPSPTDFRAELTPAIAHATQRALAKTAEDRFQTVHEFLLSLDAPDGLGSAPPGAPAPRPWSRSLSEASKRWRAVVGASAVAVALTAAVFLWPSPPHFEGPPDSIVVLPFHVATTDIDERSLAARLAYDLTVELNRWETISAVPTVALSGPLFDLDIAGPTLEFVRDGVRVARELGVQALLAITAEQTGDSVEIVASLVDARSGEVVDRPVQVKNTIENQRALVVPVASSVLGFEVPTTPPAAVGRRAVSPAAVTQEQAGRRLIERWRLPEAAEAFRRALALDSTLAMSHHLLAQTLYWQTAEDARLMRIVGPEIAAHSAAAVRLSTGMTRRDSLHIDAFFTFQQGDYAGARSAYRAIVQRDSADVYGWLMRGTVEFTDPWLAPDPSGSLYPRANLNDALRAFNRTVRLQPGFDLGYGHQFDIYRRITRAADAGVCDGFERPRDETLPPWSTDTPHDQLPFCATALDSLVWLDPATLDRTEADLVRAGADRLFAESHRLLERWVAYAPSEPKPKRELAAALLEHRGRQQRTPGGAADTLATRALALTVAALAHVPDTLPLDLLHVGAAYLVTGQLEAARRHTDRGFDRARERPTDDPIPTFAANVFLASGQPQRALDLISTRRVRRFVPDPDTGRLVGYGGGEIVVRRIAILGATGVRGAPLERELADLRRLWSERSYSDADRRVLFADAALRIAPALARDPSLAADWDRTARFGHPLWKELTADTPDLATIRSQLGDDLRAPTTHLGRADRLYLAGMLAARAGDHRLAVQLFARTDSIPLDATRLTMGWGLQPIAGFHRGVALEALGDPLGAAQAYDRFAQAWTEADVLARPLAEEATRRARRLRQ